MIGRLKKGHQKYSTESNMGVRKVCYRALTLVFVVVCISQRVSSVAPLHVRSEEFRIPGQYIVVLKDDVDVKSFSSAFEASVLRGTSEGKIKHQYQHALNGFSAQLSKGTLKKLLDSEHVEYIEEDGITRTADVPWGLDRVDERDLPLDEKAPAFLGRGANTHIYVIDTGVRRTHGEFSGRVGSGYGSTTDCHGHGTHCAGIAAGTTYGVANQATVHSVQVIECDGTGANSATIAGIDWIITNKQTPAVASMSINGGKSTSLNNAVKSMYTAGIVCSVAAGNENTDACDRSPSSLPEAITVGATESNDARASFSNYGSCIDIFAPGNEIKSAYKSSDTATAYWSGTSMACPHVSGAAAALLGVKSSLTPAQVTYQLVQGSTQDKVTDTQSSANRLLYIGTGSCMPNCSKVKDASCTNSNKCAGMQMLGEEETMAEPTVGLPDPVPDDTWNK